jgi:uncharacterized protein (TIGR00730 family)
LIVVKKNPRPTNDDTVDDLRDDLQDEAEGPEEPYHLVDPADVNARETAALDAESAESADAPPPETRRKPQSVEDLIAAIKETADRMADDGPSRGDLKILNRTLRELRYAFKVFSPYRGKRKVTVFGSARTIPSAPAYVQAVEFSRKMASHGWMVVTGAASGIMEAGHVGAGREHSMGLNIMLPFEQSANSIIAGDHKLVHMKYFFTRKLMFVKECDAVVCLPGGFGTLDEALEVLTLLQTGKRDIAPVVLLDAPGGSYWSHFERFVRDELLPAGLISPEDVHLYKITDNCDEAVEECLSFFRVYHSMRYVRERLVFRLKHSLTDKFISQIRACFADILPAHGVFEQRGPLAAEKDEPQLADMTRLVFPFNRRSLGRLRLLIDCINRGEIDERARCTGIYSP